MSILVTGANGFLGKATIARLLAHNQRDIRCLVRPGKDAPELERLQREHPEANLEICYGNLMNPADLIRALEGVTTVYHLAASLRGSPADIFMNTVVGSKRLLDVIGSRKPMRIVHISSFSVYGAALLPRGAVLDENTPLEPHPERRDPYALAKLRQEQLFWEYQKREGFDLVVLRPGVIYGPGGSSLSTRVGLRLPGLFLRLGGSNLLPLSYVDNCAEAIVVAGLSPQASGQIYNVHDDNLPTAKQFLRQYRQRVERLRSLPLPYFATRALSRAIEKYHHYSRGQLPAILTPYKAAALWQGQRFTNARLKSLGWQPLVTTEQGIAKTLTARS